MSFQFWTEILWKAIEIEIKDDILTLFIQGFSYGKVLFNRIIFQKILAKESNPIYQLKLNQTEELSMPTVISLLIISNDNSKMILIPPFTHLTHVEKVKDTH